MTTHEPPNAGGAGNSHDHDPIEAIQRAEQAERLATVSDFDREPRKRRRWPKVLGGIVLVLLVIVALAPTIAGPVLRPVVERRLTDALGETVRIESIKLGWLGGQSVRRFQIVNDGLQEEANLTASLDRSLLKLALSPMNLGTIRLEGSATLTQRDDGSWAPLPPASDEPSEPIRLPESLAGNVRISNLTITLKPIDGEATTTTISDTNASLTLKESRLDASIEGQMSSSGGTGRIDLDLASPGFRGSDGGIDWQSLSGDLALKAEVDAPLLRALAGERFASAGGGALDLTLTRAGANGRLKLDVNADHAGAAIVAELSPAESGWRLTLPEGEASVRAGGPLLAALVPELARLTGESVVVGDGREFTLDAAPDATITLSGAAATIDPDTRRLVDLRGELVLETGRLTGWLGDSAWTVEPLLATAAARDLAGGFDIQAVTSVTLDGSRAGEVSLLADALHVFSSDGTPAADPATLLAGSRTTLDITEIATGVVEPLLAPLLEGTGVSLTRDLGPVASGELSLLSAESTDLRASLRADNVDASLGFTAEQGVLRSTAATSSISIASAAAPLGDVLARTLGAQTISIDEGAAIELRLASFALDLNAQQPGGPLDLRTLAGVINASVGRTAGRVTIDGAERSFVLRPTDVELDFRKLTEGASLLAGAAIELDGRPAGTLNAAIDATQLLDESGAPRPGVPPLSGEVALRSIRSDLLDPWLKGVGIASADLLGSSADVLIIGTQAGDDVRIEASLASGGLEGGGDFTIADRVISTAGPLRLEHRAAGALVAPLLPRPLSSAPAGELEAEIASLRVGPDGIESLEAAIEIRSLDVRGDAERSALIERLNAAVRLAADGGTIELNGVGTMDDAPLVVGGRFDLPRTADGAINPLISPPTGRLDLTVPAASLGLFADAAASSSEAVLALVVGDTIELGIDAEAGRVSIEAAGSSRATRLDLAAELGGGDLRVTDAALTTTLTEESLRQLRLQRAAESGAFVDGPMLGSPLEIALRVGGFTLIEQGAFSSADAAPIRLETSGSLAQLRAVRIIGSDGLPRTIRQGEFGVEGLLVEAALPVAALIGGGEADITGTIRGTATGNEGTPITQLTGSIDASLAGGGLAGPLRIAVELPDVDTALIDDSLSTDSFLVGLFGASASFSFELAGISEAGAISDAGLTFGVESPRLHTGAPVVFDIASDRVTLADPVEIAWRLDPVFATRHLLDQPAGEERVRMTDPIAATITVDRLDLGRGDDRFRGGLFAAHADISAPTVRLEHRDEVEAGTDAATAAWIQSDFSPLAGEVKTESDGTVTLKLAAARDAEQSLLVEARVRDLQTGSGVISLLIEGTKLPTEAVEAITGLAGLAEVAGPYSRVRAGVQNLSKHQGDVNVSFVGDRAAATLLGRVEDGVFRNTDPVSMQIDLIRPQLGRALSQAVPVMGRVTKTREDGPASFNATDVALPINAEKPMHELDADFTIDIGTARFAASSAFGELLKVARQPVENRVGRKLDPMVGTIRKGQITYDRFKIPLGEFTLISEGAYNIGTKRTDITTYIPVGALSDQAMGVLNTGLGSQLARLIPGLERVTMIPWRVTGVPGNLTIRPDIDALRKDLTSLLNPINLIDGVINGADSLITGNGDKQPKERQRDEGD